MLTAEDGGSFVICLFDQFIDMCSSLRKKCPYLVFFWSVFSRIQTENSEYGHFLRSESHVVSIKK